MAVIPGYEKILAIIALGAFLLSGAWARRQEPHPAPRPAVQRVHGAVYIATIESNNLATDEVWENPRSQARGAEWMYEMFTPPEIFYDPQSREFSVTPPTALAPDAGTVGAPDRAIVRPEPFRLQLVGFVGGEGSYLGTFENLATTEHILARSGRTFPELAVTIRDFQVKRIRRESDDSMPISELIATAIVRDERTGEDVVLTNLEPAYVPPHASP